MTNINELRQRLAFMDEEGNEIDDADVMANPKKYGLKPFRQTKPSNWKPKPDPEHEAFVQKQYEDFDETMGIIKVQKEDLEKDRESYESSVIRKPRKHRPKKPTQQDRVDVMEARLRQRLARIYES